MTEQLDCGLHTAWSRHLRNMAAGILSIWLLSGCVATQSNAGTDDGSDNGKVSNPQPAVTSVERLKLDICPRLEVSNAPAHDNNRRVLRSSARACLNGVSLDVVPAPEACLTSGYGVRGTPPKMHKGVDFQSRASAPAIVAAAPGEVVEAEFRNDLGNWVVIDHGNGVVTSYGHLKSITPGLQTGQQVDRGQQLGIMGKTRTAAIHLHYEVREGNYAPARNFFLLTAVDPFDLPGVCAANS